MQQYGSELGVRAVVAQHCLADDRVAIARAQRRLKAQLELKFDEANKVYRFFDFSKAQVNKSGKVKVVVVPTQS